MSLFVKENVLAFHNSHVLIVDYASDSYPSFDNLEEHLVIKEKSTNNKNISFICLYSNRKYEVGDYLCHINDYFATKIRDPFIDNADFMMCFQNAISDNDMETTLTTHFINYYKQSASEVNVVAAKDPVLSYTCYKVTKPIKDDDEILTLKGFVYALKYIASSGLLCEKNIGGYITFIKKNYDMLSIQYREKTYIDSLFHSLQSTTDINGKGKLYIKENVNGTLDFVVKH